MIINTPNRESIDPKSFQFQKELNTYYLNRLAPASQFEDVPSLETQIIFQRMECVWNAFELSQVDASALPETAEQFLLWYRNLHKQHRDHIEPFFEYIAHDASMQEIAYYIAMEEQVDGRFDDVIALAQLGLTSDMKLALAENYWDEMGKGELAQMHTTLFCDSARYMHQFVDRKHEHTPVPAEALANGNVILMYALNRQFCARLLGVLAILEHTAPYRFSRTVRGMQRCGIPTEVIYYHDLHIKVDADHGKDLLERVLLPLITSAPHTLREVCLGCMIRLNVAQNYYASLARTLGITDLDRDDTDIHYPLHGAAA